MSKEFASTDFVLQSLSNIISLEPAAEKCINNIVYELLNKLINRMKTTCRFFAAIYATFYLCGSCRDTLKISRPDEFDFNILIELFKAVIVDDEEDSETVKIDLNYYKEDSGCLKIPRKWLDNEGFLRVQSMQSYFEGILQKTLITQHSVIIAGHSLSIKLRKSGPAHTLLVEIKETPANSSLNGYKISVDLVLGIVFNLRRNDEWIAIPKPRKGAGNFEHIEFVPSHPKQESDIMKDKQNMKNVLRLVKKIRDRKNIQNLKSYFIKTVFLWVNRREGSSFWNKSLEELIEKMLIEIVQRLNDRQLPFYWRPKFNMLSKFRFPQIDAMRDQMSAALKHFRRTRNTIALCNVFLTEEEKKKLLMDIIIKNKIKDIR